MYVPCIFLGINPRVNKHLKTIAPCGLTISLRNRFSTFKFSHFPSLAWGGLTHICSFLYLSVWVKAVALFGHATLIRACVRNCKTCRYQATLSFFGGVAKELQPRKTRDLVLITLWDHSVVSLTML